MKTTIACAPWLALLVSPALARAAAVSVTSDSECPSASAVTTGLAGLLPAGGPVSAEARIRTQDDHQTVVLSSEGEPVHSRELPPQADCEARAQAAVLIIAAWLDAMPAGAFDLPELTASSDQPARSTPAAVPSADAKGSRVWLGLGALGMIDVVGMNVGLTGEVGLDRAVGPLGLALAMSAALSREVKVGQGTARWWRPALGLDLRLPLLTGDWNLETSLGPLVGLVVLHGRGYDQNTKDVVRSWGTGAGLRSFRTWGHARVWIELKARLWPQTQRIRNEVQGASEPRTEELPRWEAFLGLGFSLAAR